MFWLKERCIIIKINKTYVISNEKIVIRTAIPFKNLIEMEIYHDMNMHVVANLCVIADQENQNEILNTDWAGTTILILKEEEESEPLFNGVVDKVAYQKENQFLMLRISGIGETVKLDREKKKQSFQNVRMTYRQVAQEVIKDYKGAKIIWNIDGDKELVNPLIQYNETDWEFLMRLCSHFNEMVVADLKSDKPTILFGMSWGKERSKDEAEILGRGFDNSYYQNGCFENEKPRSQSFYLEVKTKKNWQIGDFYFYEGEKYRVYKQSIIFKNGELYFVYRLGLPGTYYQKKIYNGALVGVRIEGTIKKTKEETVYLQLDMDKEEKADYPWIWMPETNNLCYCMPEPETKATLYFSTQEERDGRVILATVQNTQNSTYLDTQKREFVTKHHKRIGLYPDRLFIEGINADVSFSMDDQQGIQMVSTPDISFIADGAVYWEGRNIKVNAPLEVVCRTIESNIELCRDINLYAPGGVKTIGTGNGVNRKNDLDSGHNVVRKDTEHWQASFSAIAALPVVDFGKIQGQEDIIDLFACGGVPKVANGSTTISLSEVMEGKKESESSFPESFKSMDNYTVKGGYALPDE